MKESQQRIERGMEGERQIRYRPISRDMEGWTERQRGDGGRKERERKRKGNR